MRASLFEDYRLQPMGGELAQFVSVWRGLVAPVADGYTLRAYDAIPEFTIKGEVIAGATAQQTASFPTKTAAMHSLRLGIDPTSGAILDASAGLSVPGWKIGRSALRFEANHIPLIMGVYPIADMPDRTCVSVNGSYDLETRTFSGYVDFLSLGDIWSA